MSFEESSLNLMLAIVVACLVLSAASLFEVSALVIALCVLLGFIALVLIDVGIFIPVFILGVWCGIVGMGIFMFVGLLALAHESITRRFRWISRALRRIRRSYIESLFAPER